MAQTTTDTVPTEAPARTPRGGWLRFARHFAEMMIAMFLGMAILAPAFDLLLLPFGTVVGDGSIGVVTGMMAIHMTIPMVAWMHFHHRMPVARSAEMTAAMFLPTIAALVLHEAGQISAHGVMIVQHLLMVPAMLAAMLWRRAAYSH